jgi:nitrous oxidase accessory protein NosD
VSLFRSIFSPKRPLSSKVTRPKSRRPIVLRLEYLEERCTPTVQNLTHPFALPTATIQAAVDNAQTVNGDVLLATAGTYAEAVTINKSITLEGTQHGVDARTRSGAESIVDGTTNGGKTPFDVTANNVTIDGFTVQGATNVNVLGFGIVLGGGTSGGQVVNNIIQNNIAGLSLANNPAGSPALIQHNLFQNNNQSGPVSGTAIYTDQFNAGGKLANVTIDSNSFLNDQNAGVTIGSTDATKGAANITISNNVMTGEGNGVLLFNLTNGVVTGNTITGSLGSQVVIGGGVNGAQITNNFIQNGATVGIRIGDFGGGSTNSNVTANDNLISGNPTAGLEIDSAAGAYTGTLDATQNFWGSPSGPTTPNNPGGTGDKIIDPNNQVTFSPFLTSGVDSQPNVPGFQPAGNALSAVVVNGAAGNDTVVVTTTGPDSGSYTVNGGPPIAFSNNMSFTFNGGAGDSLIIHNPAGGLFAPPGGVIYNGGSGGNSLQILDGFAANQIFTFSPNSAGGGHNGTIAFVNGATTANYTYSNLTPVLVNAGTPNSVVFNLPNDGQDDKAVVQAAGAMSQIVSQVGAFETTTFVNPGFPR